MKPEIHRSHRAGWLRASVLGANDGLLSTASIIVGVAAADATHGAILTAGIAGLVAGAMSMAAGEYVSVSSQKDAEEADLAIERDELAADPEAELEELTAIYIARGVDATTARRVAGQMMAHDALSAHARDELGISEQFAARPVQAAVVSAFAFSLGAGVPLGVAAGIPGLNLIPAVIGMSLVFLAVMGGLAARVGGASMTSGALRVTVWGVLSMSLTMVVGDFFGALI